MKPPSLSTHAAVRLLAAALLAASAGPALAATTFKMRIPVGPIVAAAPALAISIPGYNPATGTFQSANGSFNWDGTSYAIPSGTAFGITGPVALTPAVTASDVKSALRSIPYGTGGTFAATYLAQQGLYWQQNEWNISVPGATYITNYNPGCSGTEAQVVACMAASSWGASFSGFYVVYQDAGNCQIRTASSASWWWACQYTTGAPVTRAATQADWDALPDPLPAVGAELPYAPYMPAGVAVQNNFTITDLSTGTVHHCTNGGCD